MVAQTKTVEPTVVNGINVDDLLALIEGVKHDAANGMTSWRVATTWQGQTRSRAEVDGLRHWRRTCVAPLRDRYR